MIEIKNLTKIYKLSSGQMKKLKTKSSTKVAVDNISFKAEQGEILGLSRMEWIAVTIVIGAVLAAEAVNSSIEALADLVSPEYNEAIKRTKDLAAGAVLLMAIAAAIVGFIIFIPKIATIF